MQNKRIDFSVDPKETFLAAIKASKAAIFKIASVYTHTTEDRNDLVQEIHYQLWKSFGTYNQMASLSTWVYRVALNVAIHYLKSAQRMVPTVQLDDHHLAFRDRDEGPDAENWLLLKRAINHLNLLEKGVLVLYLEDKTYEEIAEIIGITVSNVGTKLSRIKNKLKQQIKQTESWN